MAGQNAFAFDGTAFVPEDRNLTAGISVFSPAPTRRGVSHVYTMSDGVPATQVWMGYPPTPSAPTYRNVLTGSYPNYQNSIWVDWESDLSTVIASFDVFAKVGGGSYTLVANIAAEERTYNYGPISANTTYSFYIRANGTSGLNVTGAESSTSIASPTPPTNLRETSVSSSSLTWTWDFPAGKFQRFYVYHLSGSLYSFNTEVLPSQVATSATHTRSGLAENTSYSIRVIGQDYNGFWSTNVDDAATSGNAAPAAPTISASAVDVASEPAGNTNTTPSVTRYINVTVDAWDDPLFAQTYLEVSSDNVNWTPLTSWTDNTASKTYSHAITVTSTSTGVTRYYRARQRDSQNLYSGFTSSVSATTDTMGSTYVSAGYWTGAGGEVNAWYAGSDIGVSDWVVTSTYLNNVQDYGGDQAFDGNLSKAWRSQSVTNARIRIKFPITGNWTNGISGVKFWPAQAYNTYVQVAAITAYGTTWFGTGTAPGTNDPYTNYISSSNVSPNVMNTVNISPDALIINDTYSATSTIDWYVRLVFTSTTARTFEVNEIEVKKRFENATWVDTSYYRYW